MVEVFGPESFEDFQLAPRLVECIKGFVIFLKRIVLILCVLERLEYDKPTLVQRAAFPVLLQKQDALIKAETGSGKVN